MSERSELIKDTARCSLRSSEPVIGAPELLVPWLRRDASEERQ